MKKSLDHLPPLKRAELLRVVEVLKSSFEEAIATKNADRLKNGKILKIILYGSYARGDWVEDPVGRYFSDFDILIVVDHEDLTDSEYWEAALRRTTNGVSRLRTPVSFIVHSIDDVNRQLERGRSFFVDIFREGVELYGETGITFVPSGHVSPDLVLKEAEANFAEWFESGVEFEAGSVFYRRRGNARLAVFHLHQTVESLYHCLLLVITSYSPKSHNLVHLRRHCEPIDARLRSIWPHETKFERRCFELLRAAYIKARYSRHYHITDHELDWLAGRVPILREAVATLCAERLEMLRRQGDGDQWSTDLASSRS